MFMNFSDRQTLRRCAIVAVASALLTSVFESESQAGPLRRMRRRAARAAYGTVYRTGYPIYTSTSGYVGPTYFGPSYSMFGPIGGYGSGVGAFDPGYYGGYAGGPAAPLPPAGSAPGRQYHGAQPLAPPLVENPRGLAGAIGPRSGPAATRAAETSPQATLDNAAFIRQLYRDNLNREPDETGLNAWVQALERGMSRRAAANYFLNSRERAVAPSPNRPATTAGPTLAPPQSGPALAGPENGAPAANFDDNEELPVPPRVADQSNNGPPPRARARNQPQAGGFEF